MIQTGSRLFDFSLENQYGETITSTGLSNGRVLVVFYPWAFSRVCGSELATLQEHHEFFAQRQVRVIGISVDHKFTLRNYAESLGLDFELLAELSGHMGLSRTKLMPLTRSVVWLPGSPSTWLTDRYAMFSAVK